MINPRVRDQNLSVYCEDRSASRYYVALYVLDVQHTAARRFGRIWGSPRVRAPCTSSPRVVDAGLTTGGSGGQRHAAGRGG